MKREILFRGKLKKSNKFIYGLPTCDFSYIFNSSQVDSCDNYEVIPETIGQFTGIKIPILNGTKEDYDKDGNYKNLEYIFENDILEVVAENIRSISCYQEYQPKIGDRYVVKCFESGYMLVPINRINSNDEILFCEHKNISNYYFSNNRRSLLKIGNIYDNPELLK